MQKIIIATHHKLASGFKATLEYIVPNTVEIIDINAYIDNVSVEDQVVKALAEFEKDEQIFVFTDIMGGSVNQEFAKRISEYNIELISGTNLPILMTIALKLNGEKVSADIIREEIKNATDQLVYVNDSLLNQAMDEDDE